MTRFLYNASPGLLIVLLCALSLIFAVLCHLVARRVVSPGFRARHRELIYFTAQNVTVLYSVLLAFLTVATWQTLGQATDHADLEADLIGNLYHDAGGLSPDLAADLRGHIMRYNAVIIEQDWPSQARGQVPLVYDPSLARLHRHIASLEPTSLGDAAVMSDMLRTLNQIDNERAARVESAGGHIPALIWILLAAMGALTIIFVTLIDGQTPATLCSVTGGLLLGVSIVIVMIIELDNPFRGIIHVSVAPYQHVMNAMKIPTPAEDEP